MERAILAWIAKQIAFQGGNYVYTIYRRVCARSSTRSLTTPHILLSMVPGECRRKERAPGGCLGMAERDKERESE